jgi:hypothetical protein
MQRTGIAKENRHSQREDKDSFIINYMLQCTVFIRWTNNTLHTPKGLKLSITVHKCNLEGILNYIFQGFASLSILSNTTVGYV